MSADALSWWTIRLSEPLVADRRSAVVELRADAAPLIPALLQRLQEEWSDPGRTEFERFQRAEALWRVGGDLGPLYLQAERIQQQTLPIDPSFIEIARSVLQDLPDGSGPLVDLLLCRLRCRSAESREEVREILISLLECGGPTFRQLVQGFFWPAGVRRPRNLWSRTVERESQSLLTDMENEKFVWTCLAELLFERSHALPYELFEVVPRLSQIASVDEYEVPGQYKWESLSDDSHRLRFWSACALWRIVWERSWVYPALLYWLEFDYLRMDLQAAGTVLAELAIGDRSVWQEVRRLVSTWDAGPRNLLLEAMLERSPQGWSVVWTLIDDLPTLHTLSMRSDSLRQVLGGLVLGRALNLMRQQADGTCFISFEDLSAALSVVELEGLPSAAVQQGVMSLLRHGATQSLADDCTYRLCSLVRRWTLENLEEADARWNVVERAVATLSHAKGRELLLEGCLGAPWEAWESQLAGVPRSPEFLNSLLAQCTTAQLIWGAGCEPPGDCSRLLGSPDFSVRKLTARRLMLQPDCLDTAWPDVVAALHSGDNETVELLLPAFGSMRSDLRSVVVEVFSLLQEPTKLVVARARTALSWLLHNAHAVDFVLDGIRSGLANASACGFLADLVRLGVERGISDQFWLKPRLAEFFDPEALEELFAWETTAWDVQMGMFGRSVLARVRDSAPIEPFPDNSRLETLPGFIHAQCFLPYLLALLVQLEPSAARSALIIPFVREIRRRYPGNPGLSECKRIFDEAFAALPDLSLFFQLVAVQREVPELIVEMLRHPVSWFRWGGLVLVQHWTGSKAEFADLVRKCEHDRIPLVVEEATRTASDLR